MKLESLFRGCNPSDCGLDSQNCALARIVKKVSPDDTDASNFIIMRLVSCQNLPASEKAIQENYGCRVPSSMRSTLRRLKEPQLPQLK